MTPPLNGKKGPPFAVVGNGFAVETGIQIRSPVLDVPPSQYKSLSAATAGETSRQNISKARINDMRLAPGWNLTLE